MLKNFYLLEIDYELRVKISQVCGSLDVDGLRGDIVTNRAAKALCCLQWNSNKLQLMILKRLLLYVYDTV